MSADIFCCHGCGVRWPVLLVISRPRPGMVVSVLPCTGRPTHRVILPQCQYCWGQGPVPGYHCHALYLTSASAMWFNLIFCSAHGQFHVVGGQAPVPTLLMHHPGSHCSCRETLGSAWQVQVDKSKSKIFLLSDIIIFILKKK